MTELEEHYKHDKELCELMEREKIRQMDTIQLNAAENISSKNVLLPLTSNFSSKTAEGTPGKRYHCRMWLCSGCRRVDDPPRHGTARQFRPWHNVHGCGLCHLVRYEQPGAGLLPRHLDLNAGSSDHGSCHSAFAQPDDR